MGKIIELIIILGLLAFSFLSGVKYSDEVKERANWLFEDREDVSDLPDLPVGRNNWDAKIYRNKLGNRFLDWAKGLPSLLTRLIYHRHSDALFKREQSFAHATRSLFCGEIRHSLFLKNLVKTKMLDKSIYFYNTINSE